MHNKSIKVSVICINVGRIISYVMHVAFPSSSIQNIPDSKQYWLIFLVTQSLFDIMVWFRVSLNLDLDL